MNKENTGDYHLLLVRCVVNVLFYHYHTSTNKHTTQKDWVWGKYKGVLPPPSTPKFGALQKARKRRSEKRNWLIIHSLLQISATTRFGMGFFSGKRRSQNLTGGTKCNLLQVLFLKWHLEKKAKKWYLYCIFMKSNLICFTIGAERGSRDDWNFWLWFCFSIESKQCMWFIVGLVV
jgi:hypothetical protein